MRDSNQVLITKKEVKESLAELDIRVTAEFSLLLKQAFPTREKIYQLAKLLKEELPDTDFEILKSQVISYYGIHFERRCSGQFQKTFGVKPYSWLLTQFALNFSNSYIQDVHFNRFASRLKFVVTNHINPPKDLIDINFLHLTLHKLLSPRSEEKSSGFGIIDFVHHWEHWSRMRWGSRHEEFFVDLKKDLNFEYGAPLAKPPISRGTLETEVGPELQLSQTDLDWMQDILKALDKKTNLPRYPLSRGPNKPITRQLEKIVRTMERIRSGRNAQLLKLTAKNLCMNHLKAFGRSSA